MGWNEYRLSRLEANPSLFDLSMGQNVINGLQRKSWNNLHALNEWAYSLEKEGFIEISSKSMAYRLALPGVVSINEQKVSNL